MDNDKDIGRICDLYSNKDETRIANKNEIVNMNDDKISDIENSITASLINHNKKNLIVCTCDNRTILYFSFTILIMSLGLIIFGIYFFIK
jgi:hypothetical protein